MTTKIIYLNICIIVFAFIILSIITMALNHALLKELEQEFASTRKMLQRVPEEHFAWKPHEKSYTLGRLATHVAEITRFVSIALTTNELNIERRTNIAASSSELMQIFEDNFQKAKHNLQNATDSVFMEKWKMRFGDKIIFELPKIAVIRTLAFNHLIHHRGQLSVYLRLLDIPVPGVYGPTADEPM